MKRLDRAKRIDEKSVHVPSEDGSSPSDTVDASLPPPPPAKKSDSSSTKIRSVPLLPSPYKDDYPNWTFEGTSKRNCRTNKPCLTDANLLERTDDINSFLQSVGLQKNEDFLVSPSIRTVSMGLGWARLEFALLSERSRFGRACRGADVDASVALFDKHLRNVDCVWYRQLKSHCGSVRHSGDNLTGIGDGDDEVIAVNLRQIPLHVHHLLFAVCVYSFHLNFTDVSPSTSFPGEYCTCGDL